ncbi:MAG TPA: serine/threonine-protein kinase, partial [Candidatus Nanopelagicales bacterium]|nr:serine/threonine-protein kinase [Candidatus Nanopelagicales bacterium]
MARGESSTVLTAADTLPAPSGPVSAGRRGAARLPAVDPECYSMHGFFARGGIGRIFRAEDRRLGRQVAVKELLEPVDAEEEARFVREALITARLQHPGVVPIYEAGRWPDGRPFYAMKLVSGCSLEQRIEEALSLAERLALVPDVLAVAETMAYAHSRRIIHRDLKPANILVGEFGETVVIDWGLARSLDEPEPAASGEREITRGEREIDPDEKLTMVGAIMGTPGYMSPEQARGEAADERSDVYSIGAILYQVLTGRAPFGGEPDRAGGDAGSVLEQVLMGPPPSVRALEKGAPRELQAIVTKAMARAPWDRYATAKELAEDLRRFQTGQIVAAHDYSRLEQVLRVARRHRAPIAVAMAALLVLLFGGAVAVRGVLGAREQALLQRDRAERKQAEAETAQQDASERVDDLTLAQARLEVERDPNRALSLLGKLSPGFRRWEEARLIAGEALARGPARVIRHPRGVG